MLGSVDAELVHAALDRLARLDDGFFAQRRLHARPHREGVGAAAAGAPIEVGSTSFAAWRNAPSWSGRHALDLELGRARRPSMLVTATPAVVSALAQPLHLRSGLDPQRIVGLDAQHEVHAALEVEPELQRLRLSARPAPVIP